MTGAAERLAPAQRSSRNVSLRLREHARTDPARCAVRAPDGRSCTFAELERKSDALAHGLGELGLVAGDRACLFVRPGVELVTLTHALFRTGVVPVLIDPGMGRRALLSCVERMRPRALIGVPRAHVARLLFPRAFRTVEVLVTAGRRLGWGGTTLRDLERRGAAHGPFPVGADDRRADDGDAKAAVLFTSGSTGPPKGVVYTHAMFAAQLDALARLYALEPGQVDCACFPLFALFDNALGMTSVFPPLDPSRPAACDPRAIFESIEASAATFTFGSPAIWRRVEPWARAAGKRFSTLRRLTIAGAPVPPRLVAGLRALLPPGGEVHTPYGATEALPVSDVTGAELAQLRARIEGGEGTCVGRPVDEVDVALVRVADEPFAELTDDLLVAPGEAGEICVRGAAVAREYELDPTATRLARIGTGREPWHRMGDVGRMDSDGRLWLLGRKSQRIETDAGRVMPVPLENVYATVEGVRRTALVGVGPRGRERPTLVVEAEAGADLGSLEARLRAHRRDVADTARVEGFLFHPALPVDVRHNAKIHREELKRWAEGRRR